MAHDDANGKMYLDTKTDRLRITWPDVGRQLIFQEIVARLQAATVNAGGTFVGNPAWSERMGRQLATVHPLGGCRMGEDALEGVVNHKGQVFDGPKDRRVHRGLYVCDGAIIPCSLGINPLLTISALAERLCALLAEDYRWTLDYSLPIAT
jgi:cholesterol oxidase